MKAAVGAAAAKAHKVRVFPVDARRSERHALPEQPYVDNAAKGVGEPFVPIFCNAAKVRFRVLFLF